MLKRDFISIVIILILGVSTLLQYRDIEKLRLRPTFLKYDEPFIDKAITQRSKDLGQSRSDIMINRYPVVIRLEDEVCVALQLETGSVGGTPVYCFAKKEGELIREYSKVE